MKIDELIGYKEKPEYQAFVNATDNVSPMDDQNVQDVTKLQTVIDKLDGLGYKQYSLGMGYYAKVYARPQDNFVIKIFRNDPGYAQFLKYIQDNANNPYVPKLKGKIVKLPNHFSLVRIEKLKTIPFEIYQQISFAAEHFHDKNLTNEINQKYPGLLDFIASLKGIVKDSQGRIHFDLHRSNMMIRGETPVITDPFV